MRNYFLALFLLLAPTAGYSRGLFDCILYILGLKSTHNLTNEPRSFVVQTYSTLKDFEHLHAPAVIRTWEIKVIKNGENEIDVGVFIKKTSAGKVMAVLQAGVLKLPKYSHDPITSKQFIWDESKFENLREFYITPSKNYFKDKSTQLIEALNESILDELLDDAELLPVTKN